MIEHFAQILSTPKESITALLAIVVLTFSGGAAGGGEIGDYIKTGAFTVVGLVVIYGTKYLITRHQDGTQSALKFQDIVAGERKALLDANANMIAQQRESYLSLLEAQRMSYTAQIEHVRLAKHDQANIATQWQSRFLILASRCAGAGCDEKTLFAKPLDDPKLRLI